jgi:SOS-response transcriptional repressor LexA/DNA-binding XRE family transcriptional regulator
MDHKDYTPIISRIRQLRCQYSGERGKNRFAKALGIRASTYNYYEKDRIPPVDILLKIAEITGSDIYWLLTGQEQTSCKCPNHPTELIRQIEYLTNTHPNTTRALTAFVDLLYKNNQMNRQSPQEIENEHKKLIPILGRTAAGIIYFWDHKNLASLTEDEEITELTTLIKNHTSRQISRTTDNGKPVDAAGSTAIKGLEKVSANLVQVKNTANEKYEIAEFMDCKEISDAFADAFALRIDGDSMAPRILDGDTVVMSPSAPAQQGQCAVIKLKGQIGVTCKLIRYNGDNVHIIPINENYETKIVPKSDVAWALSVLCKLTF